MYVALFTRAWIEINNECDIALPSHVALFTRAWIEINSKNLQGVSLCVALFTRAWIEIPAIAKRCMTALSPSSRGRGLKWCAYCRLQFFPRVALFTRAWIEIRVYIVLSE